MESGESKFCVAEGLSEMEGCSALGERQFSADASSRVASIVSVGWRGEESGTDDIIQESHRDGVTVFFLPREVSKSVVRYL